MHLEVLVLGVDAGCCMVLMMLAAAVGTLRERGLWPWCDEKLVQGLQQCASWGRGWNLAAGCSQGCC